MAQRKTGAATHTERQTKKDDTHTHAQVQMSSLASVNPLAAAHSVRKRRGAHGVLTHCARGPTTGSSATPSPITFSTGPGDGKVARNHTARTESDREQVREGGCETGSARGRQLKVSVRGTQSREQGGRRDPSQTGSSCLTCQ